VGGGWSDGMRVVIHYVGMLEMSIINVIFLTNVEKWGDAVITSLLSMLITNYSFLSLRNQFLYYSRPIHPTSTSPYLCLSIQGGLKK